MNELKILITFLEVMQKLLEEQRKTGEAKNAKTLADYLKQNIDNPGAVRLKVFEDARDMKEVTAELNKNPLVQFVPIVSENTHSILIRTDQADLVEKACLTVSSRSSRKEIIEANRLHEALTKNGLDEMVFDLGSEDKAIHFCNMIRKEKDNPLAYAREGCKVYLKYPNKLEDMLSCAKAQVREELDVLPKSIAPTIFERKQYSLNYDLLLERSIKEKLLNGEEFYLHDHNTPVETRTSDNIIQITKDEIVLNGRSFARTGNKEEDYATLLKVTAMANGNKGLRNREILSFEDVRKFRLDPAFHSEKMQEDKEKLLDAYLNKNYEVIVGDKYSRMDFNRQFLTSVLRDYGIEASELSSITACEETLKKLSPDKTKVRAMVEMARDDWAQDLYDKTVDVLLENAESKVLVSGDLKETVQSFNKELNHLIDHPQELVQVRGIDTNALALVEKFVMTHNEKLHEHIDTMLTKIIEADNVSKVPASKLVKTNEKTKTPAKTKQRNF